jgi:hypothetical protein
MIVIGLHDQQAEKFIPFNPDYVVFQIIEVKERKGY